MAKVGRPTKYKGEETVQKVLDYIDSALIPYKEEVSLMLEVDMETIYNWCDKHDEFLGAIKKLETKQKLALLKATMSRQVNGTGAIFQLKVNHGMIETQEIKNTGTIKQVNYDSRDLSELSNEELEELLG